MIPKREDDLSEHYFGLFLTCDQPLDAIWSTIFLILKKKSLVQAKSLSIRLDIRLRHCISRFIFFIFFLRSQFSRDYALFSRSRTLFTRPQTSFFNKTFIKNGSHDTIHTFKNYFATVFLIFSKISDI